jgi:hypothetical protein
MRKESSPSEEKTRLDENAKVRLNLTLTGRPAKFLKRCRQLGLAVSYHSAVVEALTVYEERLLDLDLKRAEADKNRAVEE